MASGNFTYYLTEATTARPQREYITVYWESSPDAANSQSKLNVYAKMYRPYQISSTAKKEITLTISNSVSSTTPISSSTKKTVTRNGWGGKGWVQFIKLEDMIIPHNSDGKRSVYIRLKAHIGVTFGGSSSGQYVGTITMGQTVKLDNLVTKNGIGFIKTNSFSAPILSTKQTFKVGDSFYCRLTKANTSSRKHSIYIRVNPKSNANTKVFYLLKKDDDTGTKSVFQYTIPEEALNYMETATATAYLIVSTYNSSGVYMGYKSIAFDLKIRSTDVPTLKSEDVALTPVPISPNTSTTMYLQNYSKIHVRTQGNSDVTGLSSGTTIKNWHYQFTNSSINKTEYILNAPKALNALTGSGGAVSFDSPILTSKSSGNYTLNFWITDSRGQKSNKVTKSIPINKYVKPSVVNLDIFRCDATGTASKSGTSAKVSFKLSGLPIYTTNISIYSKKTAETTWTLVKSIQEQNNGAQINEILPGYEVESTYLFKIVLQDSMFNNTSEFYDDIMTETVLFDLSSNAVGIGMATDKENAMQVAWDSYFDGTIYGTVQTSTSDARKKDIVNPIIDSVIMDIWNELRFILFRYNVGDDRRVQSGVIAQEIIKLFDKRGLNWKDYGIVYGDEENGYAVNYGFINAITAHISQLQETEIRVLTSRLNKLERRLIGEI